MRPCDADADAIDFACYACRDPPPAAAAAVGAQRLESEGFWTPCLAAVVAFTSCYDVRQHASRNDQPNAAP
eukprot:6139560-Pleurochrysis_carterae.AAC.1